MVGKPPRVRLAVCDCLYLSGRESRAMGCLTFSQITDRFEMTWSANGRQSAIWDDIDTDRPGLIRIDCRDVDSLTIANTGGLLLNCCLRNPHDCRRTFAAARDRAGAFFDFIGELIIAGVAIPGGRTSLMFWGNCVPGLFAKLGLNATIPHVDPMWMAARVLFCGVFAALSANKCLPADRSWPLGKAVRADHKYVVMEVNSWLERRPAGRRICSMGELVVGGRTLELRRLASAGCAPSILPDVLPYVLGIYAPSSTAVERERVDRGNAAHFEHLLESLRLLSGRQLERHRTLGCRMKVIQQDVVRTDRSHPAFRDAEGVGLRSLARLLRAYVLLNPTVGYCQGMSDLMAALLLVVCPGWDERGNPAMPLDRLLPKVFWLFARLLDVFDHGRRLADITGACDRVATGVCEILDSVAPLFGAWLRWNDLAGFLWAYEDFIVLYRRTLEQQIWDLWVPMACGRFSKQWLIYFTAAVLLEIASPLVEGLDEPPLLPRMMELFPKLVRNLNLERAVRVAAALHERFPRAPPEERAVPTREDFEFFPVHRTS